MTTTIEQTHAIDAESCILAVNGGSSSIKFALFRQIDGQLTRDVNGQIERIGKAGAQLIIEDRDPASRLARPVEANDHEQAVQVLIDTLTARSDTDAIAGIGHRVVHGGAHLFESQLITPRLMAELRSIQPIDLAHLPSEIHLIEALRKAFPTIPQVACFDTAFHRDMPRVAQLLPIPRQYLDAGIRRFGFHGLSYTSLMRQLAAEDAAAAKGRVILAHLGSGASMAAVHNGKPMDTTMAFTPTSGLMMGTRPGDIDPGFLVYLMRVEKLSPDAMDDFISHRCGLLGVSGISADVRDLIAKRSSDPHAADAVDLFCYQAKKCIGALATTLGGLDTLVFAGGIGEHSADVRAAVCQDMEFTGIKIDPTANAAGSKLISTRESRVTVRIIATDEELIIAEAVYGILNAQH